MHINLLYKVKQTEHPSMIIHEQFIIVSGVLSVTLPLSVTTNLCVSHLMFDFMLSKCFNEIISFQTFRLYRIIKSVVSSIIILLDNGK